MFAFYSLKLARGPSPGKHQLSARVSREVDEASAADLRARLHQAAAHWHLWRLTPEIFERAWHPFPAEPIRTLDALHLASALAARSVLAGMELLSLDDSIRKAGTQLSFSRHEQAGHERLPI
jgi:hypothetical protein